MQVLADYSSQSHVVQDFNLLKLNASEFQEPSPKVADRVISSLKVTHRVDSLPNVNKDDGVMRKDDEFEGKDDEFEENDDEFSFTCVNPDGSPISADEIFNDGKIRPMFPFFDRDILFSDERSESSNSLRPPLKKVFVEEQASSSWSETEEPFCPWGGKAIESSPEVCKKSNSTGFSKLWRFREFVVRSHSDGKDAFVFLNSTEKPNKTTAKSGETTTKKGKKKKSKETVSSVVEKHYGKKEGEKRKSYLPYKQGIFGFFTNINGLSRNVHPF